MCLCFAEVALTVLQFVFRNSAFAGSGRSSLMVILCVRLVYSENLVVEIKVFFSEMSFLTVTEFVTKYNMGER